MTMVPSARFRFGLLLAAAFSVAMLPTASEAYTPEQQQACSDDAFRLCGPEIPDVDRVTACMVSKKEQLSPGCRVFFRPDPEPQANAGAPLSIRPGTAKPHKGQKSRPGTAQPEGSAALSMPARHAASPLANIRPLTHTSSTKKIVEEARCPFAG